jgi:hypothetical protein
MRDEKYVDEEFVKGLLNMFNGVEGDVKIASQIFDNILNNEEDMNDFIDNYETDKTNYLKICLEHTKWSLEQNKKL